MTKIKDRCETYGEWVRSAQPRELSRAERAMLKKEREWEVANPRKVEKLDSLIGRKAFLNKTMKTLAVDVIDKPFLWKSPERYFKSAQFTVFARVGQNLLGKAPDGCVILLRPDWITAYPKPMEPEPCDTPSTAMSSTETATSPARTGTFSAERLTPGAS